MDAQVQKLWFRKGEVLRYEALLDQALHRGLILLLQLKKLEEDDFYRTGAGRQKATEVRPGTDGRGERTSIGLTRLLDSPAVTRLSPVVPEVRLKQSGQERPDPNYVELD